MSKLRLLAFFAFAVGVTCLYAADEKVTLEGTLVSSVCYLGNEHHPTGNDMGKPGDRCGTKCLEHGDPAGLLTNDQKFHVLVVSSLKLAPYVGEQVRVTGTDHDGAILIEKVELKKEGQWNEVDLGLAKSGS